MQTRYEPIPRVAGGTWPPLRVSSLLLHSRLLVGAAGAGAGAAGKEKRPGLGEYMNLWPTISPPLSSLKSSSIPSSFHLPRIPHIHDSASSTLRPSTTPSRALPSSYEFHTVHYLHLVK